MEGTLLGAPPAGSSTEGGRWGEGRQAERSSVLVRRGDPPGSFSPLRVHVKLSRQDAGNLFQSIDHRAMGDCQRVAARSVGTPSGR